MVMEEDEDEHEGWRVVHDGGHTYYMSIVQGEANLMMRSRGAYTEVRGKKTWREGRGENEVATKKCLLNQKTGRV